MSTLGVLALLVVSAVCCCGHVMKREVNLSELAPETFDICQVGSVDVTAGSSFDLTSSNFGFSNYLDNTSCATVLQSGREALVLTITFEAAYIEGNTYCKYDSLCLNGVEFCGYWAGNSSFEFLLPERRTFTIKFSTDYIVTLSGFSLHVEVSAAAPGREIIQAQSGVGAEADRIGYETLTYSPETLETYIDRCAAGNNQSDLFTASSGSLFDVWNFYDADSANGSSDNNTSEFYIDSWETSSNNGSENNYTSSSENESENNYTSSSENGSENNYTAIVKTRNYSSSQFNGSWGNFTSPPFNGTWGNFTRPQFNGTWSNFTPPQFNGTWGNFTRPQFNGTWGNFTRPQFNGTWGNFTSPPFNGTWGNFTRPQFNGTWGNFTSPPFNGTWGNFTRPQFNASLDSHTSPPNNRSINNPVPPSSSRPFSVNNPPRIASPPRPVVSPQIG